MGCGKTLLLLSLLSYYLVCFMAVFMTNKDLYKTEVEAGFEPATYELQVAWWRYVGHRPYT